MADELTTYAWCRASGGALTSAQRRRLLVATAREYPLLGRAVVGGLLGADRPGDVDDWLPTAPDSALTRTALEACADQGPDLEGHGLRTWLFGAMFARIGALDVDPELLHVASIAHDVGLASPVVGEDFTLRSADVAVAVFEAAGRPLDAAQRDAVRDGIVGHTTPGIDPITSPMAVALQRGATADLLGLRLLDLPGQVVRRVYDLHPQGGVRGAIARAIRAEASAVPRGRFALLRRTGFALAVHAAPHRGL